MENCGWVSFGDGRPLNRRHYSNDVEGDWGVNNDGEGNLSGYGWSELTGWISFHSNLSRVYIDKEGQFQGYAWGENVGWMHFGPGRSVKYMAKADPGPWGAIGGERKLASGDGSGGSFASGGHVPAADLNPHDERYRQKVVAGFINISGKGDSGNYIRHLEKPVHIDEFLGIRDIRAPPAIVPLA